MPTSTPTVSLQSKPVTSYQQQYYNIPPRYNIPISYPGSIIVPPNSIKSEHGYHPQIRPQEAIMMDYTRPILIGNAAYHHQPMLLPAVTSAVRLSPYHMKPEDIAHIPVSLLHDNHHPQGGGVFVSMPPQVEFAESQQYAPSHEGSYSALNPLAGYMDHNQNRSTPLADFADIVVAHNEGLFTNDNKNEFSTASTSISDDTRKINQSQGSDDVNALMESVSKDQLLNAEIHADEMSKFNPNQNTSFILPASVPVSDDSTFNPLGGDLGLNDSMLAVDPSKILPNSMMGGNPGSSFKSFRQRHHSEGSMLKTIIPTNIPSIESMIDIKPHVAPIKVEARKAKVKMPKKRSVQMPLDVQKQPKIAKTMPSSESQNTCKLISTTTKVTTVPSSQDKKEVWTVPKPIPAHNKTRHRRHSADSRLTSRTLLRFPYHAGGMKKGINNQRTKRKPPPLVIPPSVNTFHNSNILYQSQLHRIRRYLLLLIFYTNYKTNFINY